MNNPSQWDDSAKVYASVAPRISFYRHFAAGLVRAAMIKPGQVIVDLGCGSSGMVEKTIFRNCPGVGRLICVDASPEVLKVAATNSTRSNVSFVCAPAEEFDKYVPPGADRVICNASIWYFDLAKTFAAVRRTLSQGGRLLFDIAEWDFEDYGDLSNHPKYAAIDDELSARGLAAKSSRGSERKTTRATLRHLLKMHGFELIEFHEQETLVTSLDYELFYTIPAIVRRSLPHVPLDLGMQVLSAAMRRLRGVPLPPLRWMIVCASCP